MSRLLSYKVFAHVSFRIIAAPLALALLAGGCAQSGDITADGGIGVSAVRSVCPVVGVPAGTGDITVFDPPASRDASAIDVTATITNVRGTCDGAGAAAEVTSTVTFDVRARRSNTAAARDVTLPYFITIVRGGTQVSAKRIGRVAVHFDAGQAIASTSATATANISRAAATLPEEVRKSLTRKRKAGDQDAAIDPLATPEVRQAVLTASFEALVGFQLTEDQLRYNAQR
ncbi:hypothetical protein [Sphingomonas radiodurans]|uniref:hypothetical protein n=1 Tax=Sphingomonas radiodurans TaxID=2890321 RepID=UPI001E6280EA|nr:hypothetical protein [Sphingomonas radiodurans]WBH16763.1 hypothetical protein LLW23_01165 [Sphingomonas radiodurans]